MRTFFKILFFGSIVANMSSCSLCKNLSWQSGRDDQGEGSSSRGGYVNSCSKDESSPEQNYYNWYVNNYSKNQSSPQQNNYYVVISGSDKNGSFKYVSQGPYPGVTHH